MIKIDNITDKEDFIKHYEWLKGIPLTDMTTTTLLAKCLDGSYKAFMFVRDDAPVGILIYYVTNKVNMFIVGIWCRGNLKGFPEPFFDLLKRNGIKRARAIHTDTMASFAEAVHMKKVWSVYERQID